MCHVRISISSNEENTCWRHYSVWTPTDERSTGLELIISLSETSLTQTDVIKLNTVHNLSAGSQCVFKAAC